MRDKYRPIIATWFCVECAREGRRHIIVSMTRKYCPYGHKKKGIK